MCLGQEHIAWAHTHPNVKKSLARHGRFHLHFTSMSSSWLNVVERWYRNLTGERIRWGSFYSIAELIEVIDECLDPNNRDPSRSRRQQQPTRSSRKPRCVVLFTGRYTSVRVVPSDLA
jgi:hypothetical protein